MNRRLLWIIVAVLAVLLIGAYAAGSWYFAGILLNARGTPVQESLASVGQPADFGLPPPQEIKIPVEDVTLAGWYFENEESGNCAVQFMHGYTGNRVQSLYWLPIFWEYGCHLLAYDHRGHGESTEALHTYGYYEKEDGLAALQWLQARTGLDWSQIGVAGVSYGAATAVQMAPDLPPLAFVVADSPFSSLQEIVTWQGAQQFGRPALIFVPGALAVAELRAAFDVQSVSAAEAVARTDVPILLIHSATDEFTPSIQSRAIWGNADPQKVILQINEWGSGHARDIATDYAAYKQRIDGFVDEVAPGFGG